MARPNDEEASTLLGVGRPVLGYRNWGGYAAARDGPDTRHRDRRGWPARGQAELLQRWRPELMLVREGLEEVLREDRADRRARRAEGMQLQGNSLWLPPVTPVLTPSHTTTNDDDDSSTPRRRCRRLVVHPGGPILDRLHLSWVHEELSPTASTVPKCWMAGGRWASGEVGTVRQLAPLNQYQDPSGGGGAAFPFVGDPPTCFARGNVEAALFQLRRAAEEDEGMLADGDEGEEEMAVPYYVSCVQKLQFPHRLLDVATRPASVHRAAFLTERLQVYEWSSARGASFLSLELPAAATAAAAATAGAAPDAWPAGHQARLAWGAHPRCLWLSSHGSLCQLDLRRRRAAAFPLDPPNWPRDLLPPTIEAGGAGAEVEAAPAGGAPRGGAALLRSTVAVSAVGPVERHPLDENLLFVAADHALLTLDLRQPCRPLSVLPQAEATHLLALGLCPPPSPSSSSRPRTWIATGCRTLPRLHLHLESQTAATSTRSLNGMGLVEEWLTRGFEGPRREQRPLGYETATFVNWDCTPGRDPPVWLAGLGVLPPAPWDVGSSNGSMVLPYLTSLGDVYLQRVLVSSSSSHGDGDAVTLPRCLQPYPAAALPCGVSPHCVVDEEGESTGPLPSSALLQPWDAQSLREHRAVAVDPPAALFGGLLPTDTPPSFVSSIKPDHEQASSPSASLAAATTEVRAAVGRVRGQLGDFMARHPRSLLEVAAELERLSPGAVLSGAGGGAGGVEEALRALHAVLSSSHGSRAGLAQAQAQAQAQDGSLSSEDVVRPEEPTRTTAAAAGEYHEEVCSCEGDGATGQQPCGASACMRPARALYWQRDSEALAPRTTGMGGESSSSNASVRVHGLDEDVLQHLRGAWFAGQLIG